MLSHRRILTVLGLCITAALTFIACASREVEVTRVVKETVVEKETVVKKETVVETVIEMVVQKQTVVLHYDCVGEILEVALEAYVDHNENGRRDPEEKPLRGVVFRMTDSEHSHRAVSDAAGQATVQIWGWCSDFETHVTPPPGFRLETKSQCSILGGKCSFGFALDGADLRDADLPDAILSMADLTGARLDGINLRNADLKGINLQNANLTGATLRDCNLREANLNGADLTGANLHGVDLSGADLGYAVLDRADLRAADLSEALNLTSAVLQHAKYDQSTKWPSDFDPIAAGAVLEE